MALRDSDFTEKDIVYCTPHEHKIENYKLLLGATRSGLDAMSVGVSWR